jgi:predicted amidophosphoribosyltransferase
VCRVCRGPTVGGQALCFACRSVARRLGFPLAPVLPVRLCPLPGPLYTVLMGYKESPVREARRRFSAIVRTLFCEFLLAEADRVESIAGGRLDVALPVPSSSRPGPPPLAQVEGLGAAVAAAFPGVRWSPRLLCRDARAVGARGLGHMRPDAAAFRLAEPVRPALAGLRVLLLDDTYVSGARSQSAATALRMAGAAVPVIVPLGRVLRPDRSPRHARFLASLARNDGAGPWPAVQWPGP